jgi:putative flippase GtrA
VRFAVTLYRRFAHLVHELAKFGTIGVAGFVITIAIADTLHLGIGFGPITSFGAATAVATTFSYFANRYWTFRHRDKTGMGREYTLFFVLSGVGLLITWVFIGFIHYVLGQHSGLAYNVAQVIGTAIATLFRYWSYKKWVFLPVAGQPIDPVPVPARPAR